MFVNILESLYDLQQKDETAIRFAELSHVFLSLLALIFIWRLWNFVIYPRVYRDQVKYLPYWIPGLGHAIPFFRNSNGLFKRAKKRFPDELCCLRVAGQDIVMVTSAAQIKEIDKDTHNFGFDPFLDLMYDEIAQVPHKNKHLLWRTPAEGYASIFPNLKNLSMAHHGLEMLHSQIVPPDAMKRVMDHSLQHLETTLKWDSFYPTSVIATSADTKVISLHALCWDSIFESITLSFMGPGLLELEPNIRSYYAEWDYHNWQVTYQLPPFLAKQAIEPKAHVIEVLRQYLETPVDQRPGSVPFVDKVYSDYRASGLPSRDIAGIIFSILWALSSTSTTLAYWMLAYLTQYPEVIREARQEIAPMMQEIECAAENGKGLLADITKAHILKGCPILNSTFSETLRFTSTGSSVRQAKRDTIVEGKRIPKGTRVIIPQRVQMMNREAFGQDSHDFNCHRFAQDKSLIRKVEFRGFGGGATLCSGRSIGRIQVVTFIAFMLWRYDVEMVDSNQDVLGVPGKPFPRLDEARPSLGPAKAKDWDDMVLKLSQRKL
ncbi:cytochrome P450 monooxygenase [Penicillium tannophilum]|nr:cytochrome P450 monooxygenase [Penicillium tannophilum]